MKTTDDLTQVLLKTETDALDDVLQREDANLIHGEHPFAAYMRALIRQKGLRQQDVFLAADVPEGYGYKLISEERHTHRRDTILRLCLAAGFSMSETQKALILYGMAPLYVLLPRDIVFLTAIQHGIREVHQVNELMRSCALLPLTQENE